MTTADDKLSIQRQVFELTGCKVETEDPLVVAALFYSETLRKAVKEIRLDTSCQTSIKEIAKSQATMLAEIQKMAGTIAQATGGQRQPAGGQSGQPHHAGTPSIWEAATIHPLRFLLGILIITSL